MKRFGSATESIRCAPLTERIIFLPLPRSDSHGVLVDAEGFFLPEEGPETFSGSCRDRLGSVVPTAKRAAVIDRPFRFDLPLCLQWRTEFGCIFFGSCVVGPCHNLSRVPFRCRRSCSLSLAASPPPTSLGGALWTGACAFRPFRTPTVRPGSSRESCGGRPFRIWPAPFRQRLSPCASWRR